MSCNKPIISFQSSLLMYDNNFADKYNLDQFYQAFLCLGDIGAPIYNYQEGIDTETCEVYIQCIIVHGNKQMKQ